MPTIQPYNPLFKAIASPVTLTSSKAVLPKTSVITSPIPASGTPPVAPAGAVPKVLGIGLNTSQADAYSIVSILQGLVLQYGQMPAIREFTVNQVLCSNKDNDQESQMNMVLAFVRNQMTYVRDPVGSEYVIAPDVLISQIVQGQNPRGDCDDHVLLFGSMMTAMGFNVKVVGVKIGGSTLFNHVIASVLMNGAWIDCDPCAKEAPQPSYPEKLVSS